MLGIDAGLVEAALVWFRSQPVVFVLFYVVWTLLGLPGTPLTLAAGWLYAPPMYGVLLVVIGASLGSIIAFLLTRWVLRDFMERRLNTLESRWRSITTATEKHGWVLVFLLRLLPIAPFSLLNYLLGLTSIKISHYFIASVLGMIPCTVAYVYAGAAVSDVEALLAQLGFGEPSDLEPDAGGWSSTMVLASVVIFMLLMWVMMVYAKRALERMGVMASGPPQRVEISLEV